MNRTYHFQKILENNLFKSVEDVRKDRMKAINGLSNIKIDELENYYKKFSNYKFSNDKIIKHPSNYNKNDNFPCIFDDSDMDLNGTFGQLDHDWFFLAEFVYNRVLKEMPEYEEEASKIFTFMGCAPEPLTVPPPKTEMTRLSNGLPGDCPKEFAVFLEEFTFRFIKSNFYVRDNFVFKISSKGNPGFPDLVDSNGHLMSKNSNPYIDNSFKMFKKQQVINQNQFINSDEFADALFSANLKKLADKYDVLFMYNDQHRGQPDKFSKERKGYNQDVWKEGYSEDQIVLDKFGPLRFFSSYSHLGLDYSGFKVAAKKYRLVFAESASSNTVPNLIMSSIRKNYGDNFSHTYKCSDKKQVKETLNSWITDKNMEDYDILCFDISNYDNGISASMNLAYTRGLSRTSEMLGIYSLANSMAPGYMYGPYIKPDPKWVRNRIFRTGNPFNAESFAFTISPSGLFDVSERAKIISTAFCIFEIFSNYPEFRIDFGRIEQILKGRDKEISILNLGDNNFIVAHKKFRIKEKFAESPIFKIDESELGVFGGLVIRFDRSKNAFKVEDSAASSIIKILCPERPLSDSMRSSYELGYMDKYDLAQTSRSISIVLESIDKWMYDHKLSSSQYDICKRRLDKSENFALKKGKIYEDLYKYISVYGISSLSSFFRSILDSGGDKLFYTDLYDKCTLSEQEVLDELFFTKIDDSDVENILLAFTLKGGKYDDSVWRS